MKSAEEEEFLIACSNGIIEEVVQYLTNPLINPNCEDNSPWKKTPLLIACENGQMELVKLLLNDERVDVNKAGEYVKHLC